MMLPILISVSVTPVSYFFCASEGAVARPRRTPTRVAESASFPRKCEGMKRFQADSFAQRCMGSPSGHGVDVGSFLKAWLCANDSSGTASREERSTANAQETICRARRWPVRCTADMAIAGGKDAAIPEAHDYPSRAGPHVRRAVSLFVRSRG